MERITFDGNFCDISMCRENPCPYNGMCSQRETWERLKKYEDSGLEPEDIKVHEAAKYNAGYYHGDEDRCRWIEKELGPIDHLRDLLQAEKDGRLVVLPCKVGDHVWIDGRDAIVTEFFGYRSERYFHAVILGRNKHIDIPFTEIGKAVFLTREEAEAALAQKGEPEQ